MRLSIIWFAFGLGIISLGLFTTVPVRAQVTIDLGGSSADLKRELFAKGYTDVAIIKKSFTATTVEGCYRGLRYRMKYLITGNRKWRKEVGKCRSEITAENARAILRKNGYRRIDLESRRGAFVAIACLNDTRFRVSVDRYGDVRQERRLGLCRQNSMSPTDISASLNQQGYTRVKFTDRQLPRYVAEACRGLKRVELVISRDGEIRSEQHIGSCQRAINPRELAGILKKNGFRQIKVIDDKLPRYVAEACRKNRLLEITLNRFGRIIDQYELGQCARALTRDQLLKAMAKHNRTRVHIVREDERGFVVEMCKGRTRIRESYNPFGKTQRQENIGSCKSRSLWEITNALTERGMKKPKFFAEGCRKGRKIRIEFNRLGDPVGRKRLGKC